MAESDSERVQHPQAITIDRDLCKACGICVDLCPSHVFDRDAQGGPVVARLDDCTTCLFCERHCPDYAIEIERRRRARPPASEKSAADSVAMASSHAHGARRRWEAVP